MSGIDPRYATPLEVYEGSGSKFSIPDGVEVDIIGIRLEHVEMNKVSYAACIITAQAGDQEYEESVPAGNSAQVGIDGNQFVRGPESKVPADKAFAVNANFAMGTLITSLLNCGFQFNLETWNQAGWTQLKGHRFLTHREPVLDKDGKVRKRDNGRVIDNLTFAKWLSNPNADAATAATAGDLSDADKAKVEASVVALIAVGPMAKKDVMVKAAVDGLSRAQVVTLINSSWFSAPDRAWKIEAGNVSLK